MRSRPRARVWAWTLVRSVICVTASRSMTSSNITVTRYSLCGQLRMFGEAMYQRGPGGVDGTEMLRQMAIQERDGPRFMSGLSLRAPADLSTSE